MAEAGFIHLPTETCPDGVRCFFCCKELDGWEAEDDPWCVPYINGVIVLVSK